jgi:hypothetical protein
LSQCVHTNDAVDSAGYVDEVVETAGQSVRNLEFRLREERKRLVDILLVDRLRILEVSWKLFIGFVARYCGVAFAADGTESYIAATNNRIEFSSLEAVSFL